MKDKNAKDWLRILYVDYGIGFGGAVISLSELVNNLPDNVDPYVLSAQKREIIVPLLTRGKHLHFSMPVNYVQRERMNAWLETIALPKWMNFIVTKSYALLDLLAGYCYSVLIYRTLKKFSIDLLHINNQADINIIRAATWAGVPCVAHTRGFGFDKNIFRMRGFPFTVKRFIAISSAVATDLEKAGVDPSKISVIHNPVQIEKYEMARSKRDALRARLGIADDDVVVSIFGRVTEWKGQLAFLEAVASIVKGRPNLKVMIVGDASDDVRDYPGKVRLLAQSDVLAGRVVFAGYQQDVAEYYWASDIVVHNSLVPEPFGRVVIEAMACERAVIAMAEGGPIDILRDNVDGLLVPPRNVPELARAIETLYLSSSRRHVLGQQAIKSVHQNFTGHVIAERVVEVYSQAMQSSRI